MTNKFQSSIIIYVARCCGLNAMAFIKHFEFNIKVYGRLAQLGEHLPYKQRVTGSSPVPPTITFIYGPVVQLVRMPACHAGGRGFEPLPGRHFIFIKGIVNI